ncbi:MAG: alkaline phosphatase family protein [Methylococcales bacterium]|nr:alkaline phosphatase family protein [Methylococcales bacterium]
MKKMISLQLNELNFEYIEKYIKIGYLPNFKDFFDQHGFVRTDSENEHRLAQPWIQWPTVHTGLDYAEHGVYRLGDINKVKQPLIYETLEQEGLKVAAISPFNAKNNTKNAAFFVPDPWTKTPFVGSASLKALYDALAQVADDYADNKIALKSMFLLTFGAIANIQWKNFFKYVGDASTFFFQKKKWYRALVCDRLLADTFLNQWNKHQPDFSTLLLNGGAHLQHHYLFSSEVYDGTSKNPDWIVSEGEDPLLDILKVYDEILGDLVKAVGSDRLLMVTGLDQEPHERTTYYYRIDDQAQFLDQIGIQYTETYRLMTEDFVVVFKDEKEALAAEKILAQVHVVDHDEIYYVETGDVDKSKRTSNTSKEIFHIENRGDSLYLQLRPASCIFPEEGTVRSGEAVVENFNQLITLAQFKNTNHVGVGYFADTSLTKDTAPKRMPLKSIFPLILDAFNIKHA